MILNFDNKEQLLSFLNNYLIYDDELLAITLLIDDKKIFSRI